MVLDQSRAENGHASHGSPIFARQSRLETLPGQIRFFNIQFDYDLSEYTIRACREDFPAWTDLGLVSTFMLESQIFRCGDIVMIEVLESGRDRKVGADIARITEIRRLPGSDDRKLVLITWFYYHRGRHYESNHLQIVLCDTIVGRATASQTQSIRNGKLYDACGRRRLCSQNQHTLWRRHRQRVTSCSMG